MRITEVKLTKIQRVELEYIGKDEREKKSVYCKEGELIIKNRPEDEMVSIYTPSGALIWSGFKDQVAIDEDIPLIIVKIGDFSYKLRVN